jgi:DNA processing protein
MTALVDLVALSLLPVTWWRDVAEQLRAGDSPGDVFDRLLAQRGRDHPDTRSMVRSRAEAAIARAAQRGIDVIAWSDAAYPPALAAIVDPPPVLWVRGLGAALAPPSVAIVGSRAGSPYALAVAERLAGDLAARGLVIVSGLARGVDSAAHRGALGAPGSTVAVLGSGADVVYPREHAALAREIAVTGAVISELAPGTRPLARFFPQRNRIISGLARAVVVIEAGEKSGSLITARCALDQGRDVLAVPGNVLNGRNRGGHALLRDGAKIVETADDILEELNLGPGNPAEGMLGSKKRAPGENSAYPSTSLRSGKSTGSGQGDRVLDCLLPGESCDLDAIAERSGLTTARLLPRLFELELRGLVRRAGGGRFIRCQVVLG